MFTEQERQIFKYTLPDGSTRHIDPLAIDRELDARCGGDLNAVLELMSMPCPACKGLEEAQSTCQTCGQSGQVSTPWELAGPATARLARAVCATFKLGEPFNETTGQGVTYEEWCGVLNWFITEREKNALKAANSVTCSRPTELLSADQSATSTTAASTGT